MVSIARPAPSTPRPYNFPRFERGELDNGLRFITCRFSKLPLITLLVVVDSGSAADTLGKEGLARLTARTLMEGTNKRSGVELSQTLEELGTSLDTGADWDSSILKVTFLREHLDRVLPVIWEVLLEPAFPDREVQRLKDERIADLVQIESEPRALADQSFEEFLYSSDSRYAIPAGGSKTSVSGLRRDELLHFHQQTFRPNATTIIAAGDLAAEELARRLGDSLSEWKPKMTGVRTGINEVSTSAAKVRIVDKPDAPQSELRVGHSGIRRDDPDYFAAVVMNAVLGGLFGSRINLNLREEHGYTYGASSYFEWRKDAGPFVISTAVQTEVTGAALKEIFFEIERVRTEAITATELSLAKDYLDGVFPIRYETTAAIAAALANLGIYSLPADYYDTYRDNIRRVNAADVLRAARKYVRPEAMRVLIVGHTPAVRQQVAALGLGPIETPTAP